MENGKKNLIQETRSRVSLSSVFFCLTKTQGPVQKNKENYEKVKNNVPPFFFKNAFVCLFVCLFVWEYTRLL